jgi:hypothetical protein
MSYFDDYGIGDAQQFFGTVAPWAQDISSGTTGLDEFEQQALNQYLGQTTDWASVDPYQKGVGSGQSYASVGVDASSLDDPTKTGLDRFINTIKGIGGKALNFAQTPQGIMALLAALAARSDRARPSGGGAAMGMPAPRQFTRSVDPMGIVRYAANGGLMQAYAQGGAVRPFPMQDGGFVMTKKAVDGAGGPEGITQLLPDATMVYGRGTGTSDDIPAYIQGPNGRTPAKLSNGEAYVPPGRDTKGLYALMHELEKEA